MMKKCLWAIISAVILLATGSCRTSGRQSSSLSPESNPVGPDQFPTKVLIAYFSWSGNTEEVAEAISSQTGADLLEIVPETPYPSDYGETLEIARQELETNARPFLSSAVRERVLPDDYDNIFIGYPIWHGREPMIIDSFLEQWDGFQAQKIYLFSTSASSSGTAAVNELIRLYPHISADYLHLNSGNLSSTETAVDKWLKWLGFSPAESVAGLTLRLTVDGLGYELTLSDSSASRDLVKRLPLELTFSDFNNSEKIAYLPTPLDLSETAGTDPSVGDLTVYAPWGNLAAFYVDSSGYSSSLLPIGRIEPAGIARMAAQSGDFTALLELPIQS